MRSLLPENTSWSMRQCSEKDPTKMLHGWGFRQSGYQYNWYEDVFFKIGYAIRVTL